MAKKKKRGPGLADPVYLKARDAEEPELIVVIIETPKGSRNKYAYDPKERIFELKSVLPAGMTFPYDFGFVPSTLGGDGESTRCSRAHGRASRICGLQAQVPRHWYHGRRAGREKGDGAQRSHRCNRGQQP